MAGLTEAVAEQCPGVEAFCYLDDVLIIGKEEDCVNNCLETMIGVFSGLGLIVNHKKSSSEASLECEWLGFLLDCKRLRITKDKKDKVRQLMKELIKHKRLDTFRSLIGVLSFCSSVIVGIRPGVKRLAKALPSAY